MTADIDLKATLAKRRIVGLYRLMVGYRWLYLGALVSVAAGALMRTYYYRLVQHIVDNVLGRQGAGRQLALAAGGFVGLAALEGLFAYLRGTWSAKTAEGITRRLRNYLFDHIQRLPFAFHDYVKTGELIQRSTSDVDAVRRFFADQALGIGRILALFVVNLAMLLQMSPKLAGVSIAMMPLIVALSYFFFGRVTKAYEQYQEQEAKLSTTLQENLTGVRVVRAFARQRYEIDKFDRENLGKYRLGRRLATMHSLYWPVSDVLSAGQTVLAMAVGATMAIRGEITVGTYLAAMGMVTWVIWPMRNLGRLIVQVSTGLVSYQRVVDVIREDREDIVDGSVPMDTPIEGQIVFDHVDFAYEPRTVLQDHKPVPRRGRRSRQKDAVQDPAEAVPQAQQPVDVLKDISFRCEPGQVVALLGSTGSGKTSIINLLLRFYDYQEGSIRLDGVELSAYPRTLLRRNIGIVEQQPFPIFAEYSREHRLWG